MGTKNNYPSIICIYSDNYGQVLHKLGRHKDARRIFYKGLAASKKAGDKHSYAYNLARLANMELDENNFKIAEAYAAQSYENSVTDSIRDTKAMSQLVLAEITRRYHNNNQKALDYCLAVLEESSDGDL